MRGRQRLLCFSRLLAIHPYFRRDVRAFQEQCVHGHDLFFRQSHRLLIPSLPHIMFVGCQEELQFQVLPRIAVLCHIRIIEIAGIIERAHPFRVHTDIITLQLLRHRSWQGDDIIHLIVRFIPFILHTFPLTIQLELPCSAQVDGLCETCQCIRKNQCTRPKTFHKK